MRKMFCKTTGAICYRRHESRFLQDNSLTRSISECFVIDLYTSIQTVGVLLHCHHHMGRAPFSTLPSCETRVVRSQYPIWWFVGVGWNLQLLVGWCPALCHAFKFLSTSTLKLCSLSYLGYLDLVTLIYVGIFNVHLIDLGWQLLC